MSIEETKEEEDFLRAIANQDVNEVINQMKNVDINSGWKNNMTPLHHVSFFENETPELIKICLVLLKCGAIVDSKLDDTKETPLHFACYRGNVEITKLLLRFLADPNVSNDYGETPLYFACNFDNHEIIQLLLKHKAKVFEANKKGAYPFDKCFEVESEKIIIRHLQKLTKRKAKKTKKLEKELKQMKKEMAELKNDHMKLKLDLTNEKRKNKQLESKIEAIHVGIKKELERKKNQGINPNNSMNIENTEEDGEKEQEAMKKRERNDILHLKELEESTRRIKKTKKKTPAGRRLMHLVARNRNTMSDNSQNQKDFENLRKMIREKENKEV